MIANALAVFCAYALGSVLGGRLMGVLKGVDLRLTGSGNIGATNALRTQGARFALAVLLFDVGKGVLAVALLPVLPPAPSAWLPLACGGAAVTGHCWPLWYRFKGGKGVATLAGVFAMLLPYSFIWMLAAFVVVVLLSGVVSLATLSGAAVALLHVTCFTPAGIFSATGAFTAAMTAVVLLKHRDNWLRLARGEESRFEKARLLGRALGLR